VGKGCWNDPVLQKQVTEEVAKKLNISNLEDWYTVTNKMFNDAGGQRLLTHFRKSLSKLLQAVYPEYPPAF
jgi:hypothetical protein